MLMLIWTWLPPKWQKRGTCMFWRFGPHWSHKMQSFGCRRVRSMQDPPEFSQLNAAPMEPNEEKILIWKWELLSWCLWWGRNRNEWHFVVQVQGLSEDGVALIFLKKMKTSCFVKDYNTGIVDLADISTVLLNPTVGSTARTMGFFTINAEFSKKKIG